MSNYNEKLKKIKAEFNNMTYYDAMTLIESVKQSLENYFILSIPIQSKNEGSKSLIGDYLEMLSDEEELIRKSKK